MYIEITDMCNMSCKHCGMNSKKIGKGTYMSKEVFSACITLAENSGACIITIGGGEPMIHPLFRTFWSKLVERIQIHKQLGKPAYWHPGVITNGTRVRNFEFVRNSIAEMERLKVLGDMQAYLAVSVDAYHDRAMQKDSIVEWAIKHKCTHGPFSYTPMLVGRAKTSGVLTAKPENCFCDALQIKANGSVRPCGCENAPVIGNLIELLEKFPGSSDFDLASLVMTEEYYTPDPEDDGWMYHRKWKS